MKYSVKRLHNRSVYKTKSKFKTKSKLNKNIINLIIKQNKDKLNNTDLLAYILSIIMKDYLIDQKEYMIIASYCLKEYREVSDLDVMITPNSYNMLKKHLLSSGIGVVSIAKISKDERIVISLPTISNDAEIEIFAKEEHLGFPSNKYALKRLRNKRLLDIDKYGNQYLNIDMCIDLYSDVKKIDDKYYIGNFTITKERVHKNINHLTKILENRKDKAKIITKKIKYLEKLIT